MVLGAKTASSVIRTRYVSAESIASVRVLADVMRSIDSSPSIEVSSKNTGVIGTSYSMNICADRSAMIGNDKAYCSTKACDAA